MTDYSMGVAQHWREACHRHLDDLDRDILIARSQADRPLEVALEMCRLYLRAAVRVMDVEVGVRSRWP